MSRVGKEPIEIPNNVEVNISDRKITVKGTKGTLAFDFGYEVDVKEENNKIIVEKIGKTQNAPALWGTTRAIIRNLIVGVSEGFKKQLELQGVGYKMSVQGKKLVLHLGFSHVVEKEIPEGLLVEIEKDIMTISGADKQVVGQFSAEIRSLKKVEPYKGKGFRYVGEQVIRKEGKKTASGE
jgi:large subunit ribosomal protein L6